MKISKVYKFPFTMGKQILGGTRNRLNRSYTSIGSYALGGTLIGGIAGGGLGIVGGVVTPFYVGWQIGDYVADKLDLPGVVEVGTELVSACVTTGVAGGITVPVLMGIGIVGGAAVGAIGGTVIGTGKKGLEAIVRK